MFNLPNLIILIACLWTSLLIPINLNEILLSNNSSLMADDQEMIFGSCSRPNIPPNGRIRFASSEKVKFAENETIYIMCEENSFPIHIQKRTCRHGNWTGPRARCG